MHGMINKPMPYVTPAAYKPIEATQSPKRSARSSTTTIPIYQFVEPG